MFCRRKTFSQRTSPGQNSASADRPDSSLNPHSCVYSERARQEDIARLEAKILSSGDLAKYRKNKAQLTRRLKNLKPGDRVSFVQGRELLVSVLSPYPEEISEAFDLTGDRWRRDDVLTGSNDAHFIVSYGHRTIIKEPLISRFAGRLINLHIGFLPWNRGADPNLWSFVDDTPKGVTIHLIDKGIDTGPILDQRRVFFNAGTLASTYQELRREMAKLFIDKWPMIRTGQLVAKPQSSKGTFHRSVDKAAIWARLPLGFDTPVSELKSVARQP
jgi:hypothetical protein